MIKYFFFAFLLSLNLAYGEGQKISHISIQGNNRIENQTILSYLPIKVGDSADLDTNDQCLKTLFDTGYFHDVKVHREGATIVIQLEENPIINKIAYEGNDKIKDADFKKEIQLRPREVLSYAKIQAAQQRILEIYRRLGRFSAKVDPKIIRLPENRVDLVFEIDCLHLIDKHLQKKRLCHLPLQHTLIFHYLLMSNKKHWHFLLYTTI